MFKNSLLNNEEAFFFFKLCKQFRFVMNFFFCIKLCHWFNSVVFISTKDSSCSSDFFLHIWVQSNSTGVPENLNIFYHDNNK